MDSVTKILMVKAPQALCYTFMANPDNIPRFMNRVTDVRPTKAPNVFEWFETGTDQRQYHWKMRRDTLDFPETLSWQSEPNGPVALSIQVHFEAIDTTACRMTYSICVDERNPRSQEFKKRHYPHLELLVVDDLDRFQSLLQRDLTPSAKVLQPQEAPGDIPDISEEYTSFGVSQTH